MKIYALIQEFPKSDETHAVLNGRLFRIKKDPVSNRLAFIDAIWNEAILESGELVLDETDVTGVRTLKTSHNTVYKITRIERLLPTKGYFDGSAYDWSSLGEKELEFNGTIEIREEEGYEVTIRDYHFSVPMMMPDFYAFCRRNQLSTHRKDQVNGTGVYGEVECRYQAGVYIWQHRLYTPYLSEDDEYETTCVDSKPVNRADGYVTLRVKFDRPVSENMFRRFCKDHKMETRKKEDAAWHEEYAELKQIDQYTWEHKRIMRYTD